MLAQLRPALVMLLLLTLVTGILYPLAVTGLAQLLPDAAEGSLVRVGGRVVGSRLIGQAFAQPAYLWGRPSAAGDKGYDPTASGGSNLGPMDPKLADRIKDAAGAIAKAAPGQAIPPDAVTTSGSGLDPDISPAYAALQAPRIAAARHVSLAAVRSLIDRQRQDRTLGVLGEPRVNVLRVNLALDASLPVPAHR